MSDIFHKRHEEYCKYQSWWGGNHWIRIDPKRCLSMVKQGGHVCMGWSYLFFLLLQIWNQHVWHQLLIFYWSKKGLIDRFVWSDLSGKMDSGDRLVWHQLLPGVVTEASTVKGPSPAPALPAANHHQRQTSSCQIWQCTKSVNLEHLQSFCVKTKITFWQTCIDFFNRTGSYKSDFWMHSLFHKRHVHFK